jgi:hypothetical protein
MQTSTKVTVGEQELVLESGPQNFQVYYCGTLLAYCSPTRSWLCYNLN